MNCYLIDTHTFLWFATENSRLKEDVRSLIGNTNNIILLSIASIWECTIKYKLGKLPIQTSNLKVFINSELKHSNIKILNITPNHVYRIVDLPLHHRDPFDRLLIAQALIEEIPIITADQQFENYNAEIIWT
jgi:PIN domain nuclease of toxin-antitoxin system